MAIAQSGVRDLSDEWKKGIAEAIQSTEPQIRQVALRAAAELEIKELAELIHQIVDDKQQEELHAFDGATLTDSPETKLYCSTVRFSTLAIIHREFHSRAYEAFRCVSTDQAQ